jgi:hypothetical protein
LPVHLCHDKSGLRKSVQKMQMLGPAYVDSTNDAQRKRLDDFIFVTTGE